VLVVAAENLPRQESLSGVIRAGQMEHNILTLEGDLDPKETTRKIVEIAARHER